MSSKNPGQIVTKDILAALVGDAFTVAYTTKYSWWLQKKPGEVSDRQRAPSKALIPTPQVLTFFPEQIARFEVQYTEGYDVQDTTYLAWKSTYTTLILKGQLPLSALQPQHPLASLLWF